MTENIVTVDVTEIIVTAGAGPQGPASTVPGPGVPTGGTTGQILAKASDADLATGWIDAAEGSLPTMSDTVKGGAKLGSGLTMTGDVLSASETDPVVLAISGIVKSDGSTISAATPGTDYVATETDPVVAAISGIIKSDGATIAAAVAGSDYQTPLVAGTDYLAPTGDGSGLTGVIATSVTGAYGDTLINTASNQWDFIGDMRAYSIRCAGDRFIVDEHGTVCADDFQLNIGSGPISINDIFLQPTGDGSGLTGVVLPGTTLAHYGITDAAAATHASSHAYGAADAITITKNQISDFPTLGGAASLNVGTSSGTVAAGNDARFVSISLSTMALLNSIY